MLIMGILKTKNPLRGMIICFFVLSTCSSLRSSEIPTDVSLLRTANSFSIKIKPNLLKSISLIRDRPANVIPNRYSFLLQDKWLLMSFHLSSLKLLIGVEFIFFYSRLRCFQFNILEVFDCRFLDTIIFLDDFTGETFFTF